MTRHTKNNYILWYEQRLNQIMPLPFAGSKPFIWGIETEENKWENFTQTKTSQSQLQMP